VQVDPAAPDQVEAVRQFGEQAELDGGAGRNSFGVWAGEDAGQLAGCRGDGGMRAVQDQ
jgi:hypothetical protein